MEALLKEYAELDAKTKLLDEAKTLLREQILGVMKHENKDRETTEFGTFTVGHRTTWTYSPAVEKLEEKVKITKFKEQEKGLAKPKVSDYLLYKNRNDK